MSPGLVAKRALQMGTLSATLSKFYIMVDQQKERDKGYRGTESFALFLRYKITNV